MNIHEYQAKAILKRYNIPVQDGIIITSKDTIESTIMRGFNATTYVVKAQIHAGGRGKAGGIVVAHNKDDAIKFAHEMYGKTLITPQTGAAGKVVRRIYIESGCDIAQELYISAVIDCKNECIAFILSSVGGVNIEDMAKTNPEKIIRLSINPITGLQNFHVNYMLSQLAIPAACASSFKQIVRAIYKIFIDYNVSQIEINPMVITKNETLCALDAKIIFDDNGLFKHPDIIALKDVLEQEPLEVEAESYDLNYIKMHGNIGCMVNGAGLAMATMDIIQLNGAAPANFLDVGGSADTARVIHAFKIILSDPNVKAILLNIFGGIVKCDVIANGVVAAAKEVGLKIPLITRLAGTNATLGLNILRNSGLDIAVAETLEDAILKTVASI